MSLLKGIASDGTTVIATVHSPTAYAFSLFDRCAAGSGGRGGGKGRGRAAAGLRRLRPHT